jgi:hypothetical protein
MSSHKLDWKKTFRATWDDYENRKFQFVLSNLDAFRNTLVALQHQWEQRQARDDRDRIMDSNQLMNDHVAEFQDFRHEFNCHIGQWKKDRVPLLEGAQLHRQTLALNDHVVQTEDPWEEMSKLIHELSHNRERWSHKFDAEELRRRENNELDIRTWLSIPEYLDPETIHADYKEKWAGDKVTGRWILQQKQISEWLNEDLPPSPILWMHGKKGAGKEPQAIRPESFVVPSPYSNVLTDLFTGKSVLASIIIEECKKKAGHRTSFFYCTEDEKAQNMGNLVALKGILVQMVIQNEELLPVCRERRVRGQERLNDHRTIKSLLDLYCEYELKQYIVVDGLDELEPHERKALVKELCELIAKNENTHPGKLRLLLVSRDFSEMHKILKTESIAPLADVIELDPSKTTEDIRRYVYKRGKAIQANFKLDDELCKRMQELVCQRAEGKLSSIYLPSCCL